MQLRNTHEAPHRSLSEPLRPAWPRGETLGHQRRRHALGWRRCQAESHPETSTISVNTAGTKLNLGSTNATVTSAGAFIGGLIFAYGEGQSKRMLKGILFRG